MTVQCRKVMVCDGVDLTEEELKAFETVLKCLSQLSKVLNETFDDDTICCYGPEFQVSDIYETVSMIKDNLFTIPY